jgi:hypothetical protein
MRKATLKWPEKVRMTFVQGIVQRFESGKRALVRLVNLPVQIELGLSQLVRSWSIWLIGGRHLKLGPVAAHHCAQMRLDVTTIYRSQLVVIQ